MYKIWMTVMTKEDYQAKYDIEVRYIEELKDYLAQNCSEASNTTVYLNRGVNSDSKLQTQVPEPDYL